MKIALNSELVRGERKREGRKVNDRNRLQLFVGHAFLM